MCRRFAALLLAALALVAAGCGSDSFEFTDSVDVLDDGSGFDDAAFDFEDCDPDEFDCDEYYDDFEDCDPDVDDCSDFYCDTDSSDDTYPDCDDEYYDDFEDCDPDFEDCSDFYCDTDSSDDTYPDCDEPDVVGSDDEPESAEPDLADNKDGDARTSSGAPAAFPGGGVDPSATRNDVDCDEDALGEDGTIDFTVAYYVVDGDLGAACFGEPDSRLVDAWRSLAAITPSGQLLDLGLFGGFASNEGDETTLAFVNALDDDGSLFQMSVNLDEAEADPDELMLTMAHEFTHVFTATSPQIDRYRGPDECDTYFNGEGCYLDGSVMAEWISLFWGDYIDDVDPYADVTSADGEDRCALDAGFFGPYAASSPEEDFAEAFSAYVFRLEPDSPEQQERLDWIDSQPGLAEFRDLAVAADLGPLANRFDYCG